MIEDWLNQLPDQSVLDVPTRLALIALVLVLTWIVQRVARWLIVLLVERLVGTFIRTGDDIQFEQNLSRELVQPTQLMVVAIGLRVALALAGLIPSLQLLADRLMTNVITIAVAWGIFRVVDVITRYVILLSRTESSKLDETIVRFGRQIAIFVILVFGVVLILQQWGQDVGALVAGLGIASLAVALAAQDTLANVIGYVAIVTDAPFKVGDMVIVEDIVRGRVQEISFRSTRIRTLDNSVMAIPNKTIANANVINWARTHKRRQDIVLGVTYSTTAEQIQQVLADTRAMLQQHELVTLVNFLPVIRFGDGIFSAPPQHLRLPQERLPLRLILRSGYNDRQRLQQPNNDIHTGSPVAAILLKAIFTRPLKDTTLRITRSLPSSS